MSNPGDVDLSTNPLALKPHAEDPLALIDPRKRQHRDVHVVRNGIVCRTDKRGHATPRGRSIREIVLDASEGFIPLWAENMTLRWRFNEASMAIFANPSAAKLAIEELFAQALLAWGDAAPIQFSKHESSDFEIFMRPMDDCDASGCVLASAFFPDAGRHRLEIYPKMFSQSAEAQVATMAHEIGHIFGLRHFFAKISESAWRSEIFGKHVPFSIMNYGDESVMTDNDRADLRRLYKLAWRGELTKINKTPIQLVKPYHTLVP